MAQDFLTRHHGIMCFHQIFIYWRSLVTMISPLSLGTGRRETLGTSWVMLIPNGQLDSFQAYLGPTFLESSLLSYRLVLVEQRLLIDSTAQ